MATKGRNKGRKIKKTSSSYNKTPSTPSESPNRGFGSMKPGLGNSHSAKVGARALRNGDLNRREKQRTRYLDHGLNTHEIKKQKIADKYQGASVDLQKLRQHTRID